MLKLFNLIIKAKCTPKGWSLGLISPVHKSDDKNLTQITAKVFVSSVAYPNYFSRSSMSTFLLPCRKNDISIIHR